MIRTRRHRSAQPQVKPSTSGTQGHPESEGRRGSDPAPGHRADLRKPPILSLSEDRSQQHIHDHSTARFRPVASGKDRPLLLVLCQISNRAVDLVGPIDLALDPVGVLGRPRYSSVMAGLDARDDVRGASGDDACAARREHSHASIVLHLHDLTRRSARSRRQNQRVLTREDAAARQAS